MATALLWLRSNTRAQWRSAVLIVLIVAWCGAVSMAAVAGGRRTITSLPRFQQWSHAPNVGVSAPDDATATLAGQVMAQYVGAARVGREAYFDAAPTQASPADQVLLSVLGYDGVDENLAGIPKVVAGRRAAAADEMDINEAAAAKLGLRVGSRVAMSGYTMAAATACSGPQACVADVDMGEMTVAAVVRYPDDLAPQTVGAMTIELPPPSTARWVDRVAVQGWLTGARIDDPIQRAAVAEALIRAIGPDRVTGTKADVSLLGRGGPDANQQGGRYQGLQGPLTVERNGLQIPQDAKEQLKT